MPSMSKGTMGNKEPKQPLMSRNSGRETEKEKDKAWGKVCRDKNCLEIKLRKNVRDIGDRQRERQTKYAVEARGKYPIWASIPDYQ